MSAPARLSPRSLILLCLASAGWAFSFGLGAPLASLWLNDHNYGYHTVGLNTGIYYLGIAVAAVFVPRLMGRWGLRCVVAGCLVSAVTVGLFPYSGTLLFYYLIRLANGIAGAMTLIPLETYVNRDSPPEHRSRNFGFYAVSIALGWALGNKIGMDMYPEAPRLAFLLGGAAALLAGLLLQGRLPQFHAANEMHDRRAPLEFRRNFLSFGTAWSQGFLEGGMIGFLSLYLLSLHLTVERAGSLTSGIMLGVILFQVLIAWLADRLGRTRILLACYAVVFAGLCVLPFCGDSLWLALWLFLVGACSGAFYPLGLAILGERMPAAGLARANAWFLAINCLGSWTGPGIMGFAMEQFGMGSLFVTGLAAVLIVLVGWSAARQSSGQQSHSQEPAETGMVPPQARAA